MRGRTYEYRVSEMFLVEPNRAMGHGADKRERHSTLQTCTPIPTFDKRLIVRAERV